MANDGRQGGYRVASRLAVRQHQRCAYCLYAFGTVVLRRGRYQPIILSPTVDHIEPYTYLGNDSPRNVVAACQVCQHIKGARIFSSIQDIQTFVRKQWLSGRLRLSGE
jgi:5-methylcytosine-specific restriction endonuclease McrA